MFNKLENLGLSGKMLRTLLSIYSRVQCCVKLNDFYTDWFDVNTGLKQGCKLSPLLLSLFINDLVEELKKLDIGIQIGDEKVCILLYADDVVLLAENETELQLLLGVLNSWCCKNDLEVNYDKSKIVHFRNQSRIVTSKDFHIGDNTIEIVTKYNYLGFLLLNF